MPEQYDIIRPVVVASTPSDHDVRFDAASPSSQYSRRTASSDPGSVSQQTLKDLCSAWFERYHSWFPILHKLSLLQEVQNHASPLVDSPQSIVFKAVVAVTLPHWCLSNPLTQDQRSDISARFRNEVIMQAIGSLSLQSLQAILIITTIDYGAGKLSEFWNLVALCKRSVLLRLTTSITAVIYLHGEAEWPRS